MVKKELIQPLPHDLVHAPFRLLNYNMINVAVGCEILTFLNALHSKTDSQ